MGTLYVDTGGSATNSGSNDGAAVASGSAATVAASTVTLDGSPDLSGLITSGAAQSAIHINDATNANMKIFWITAFDNVAKTVDVHAAPTGVVSSAWTIGGRHVLTNASIEGALRAGDTIVINNTPAARTGASWTFRNNGDSTSGPCKVVGKTGVRPVLETTNNATCITMANMSWLENVEIVQSSGAGGLGINAPTGNATIFNVKISDSATNGITCGGGGRIIGCEITGVSAAGIALTTNAGSLITNCYIHNVGTDGILISGLNASDIEHTILDSNTGRGINITSASAALNNMRIQISNCTIYGNGNSGLEVADADTNVYLTNNIFLDNGDAAGEYNVEWAAGAAEMMGYHGYNCFHKAADNLSGITANSTEITSDPLLIDPANGDFRLAANSPCKGTGAPGSFLGNTSVGYIDMGAVQRREATLASGAS